MKNLRRLLIVFVLFGVYGSIVPAQTSNEAATAKTFSGSISLPSVPNLNNTRYVDGSVYPTIQSCIDSFGSSAGVCVVPTTFTGESVSRVRLPDKPDE